MQPEALFEQLLGLGADWRVHDVSYSDGEVRLFIEDRPHLFEVGSVRGGRLYGEAI